MGRLGEGRTRPAELPFCMTQWFLEKALPGFCESGLRFEGHGGRQEGPRGLELILKSAGIWVRVASLSCFYLVFPTSEIPFMKEMEYLPLCFVLLGW